jgi:hypothetical protein
VHDGLNSNYFDILSEQKHFGSGDRQLSFMNFTKMQRYQRGRFIVTKILISGFDMPVIVSNGKKVDYWISGVRAALRRNSERLRKLAIEEWRRQGHEITDDLLQNPMTSNDLLQAPSVPVEESSAKAEEPMFQLFEETDVSLLCTEIFRTTNPFGFPQDDAFLFDKFT